MKNLTNFLKMLGPGLLFAGAAIGVSHLVQSTKAGATYGFGLLWIVLLVHLLKYPFFEFGPRYASVTGKSLLSGYQKMGKPVMAMFILATLGTMFTIQAAVTIVTAALASSIFGITSNLMVWVLIILGICSVLLWVGQYKLLDNLMKVVIITLTISTLFAVGFAFGKTTGNPISIQQVLPLEGSGLVFLIALMGWLPAPLDLSVWHSLWAVEKQDATTDDFSLKKSLLDFNIGYGGTIILATAFLILGALVMYGSGETFSDKGGEFAGQLINLYTSSLGEWSKSLIQIAAFTAMFSTTLTCLDAIPRTMGEVTKLFLSSSNTQENPSSKKRYFWIWLVILLIGTLVLLNFFISSMGQMVKIATILSFLTAPFFAIVNYRLVTDKDFPKEHQPQQGIRILSWIGMIFLIGFGIFYGLITIEEWLNL